ncbi:MAG: IMP cyclohydrolase [Deltaproteobacteria bacterium]|nr:IMP cyclohydrolase [Deltaproteobacteria bacterium]
MSKIQRALISVTDKDGIVEFAQALNKFGVEILSTGGTAKALAQGGVKVKEVADYTGFPELLDGRVKTLHPKVHAGILFRRNVPAHVEQMDSQGLKPIDLVCVNLYAFEDTIAKHGVTLAEAIENIDIGGPTMLRAAAKNYESVTVIVDPTDYPKVITEMKNNNGQTTLPTRLHLARKVFSVTYVYDRAILKYLQGQTIKQD